MLKYLLDRLFALSRMALGVALTRAFSILLFVVSARTFSPDENGRFIQAVAIPQVLAQIGTLGWLPLILKEVSGRSNVPTGRFKGFVILSAFVPLSCITIISAAILGFGLFTGDLHFYGTFAAFTLVSTSAVLLKEYLLSLRHPAFGTIIVEGFPFAFASLLIWWIQPRTVPDALAFLIIGGVISILVSLPVVWFHLSSHMRSCEAVYDRRFWARASLFSFLGTGGRSLLDRLDVIILSLFAMASQLAVYNSALRVANLLLLPAVVLLPVFSPHLSVAARNHDSFALRRDMQLQAILVAALALPFAVILLSHPETIIGFVFGMEYANVGGVMTFMIMAQMIFAFSLPWSNLALMRGRVRLYGTTNLVSFIVGAGCAVALLPTVGALAVAVGSMIGNTLSALVFFGAELPELMGRDEA